MGFETFEQLALTVTEVETFDAMRSLNASFDTRVMPENGFYGMTRVDKGLGAVEITGRNEQGLLYREYLQNDTLVKMRASLGNREWATTYFDEAGQSYLTVVSKNTETGVRFVSSELAPNTTITKGSYSATTDAFGRTVYARMEDVQLKPVSESRQALNKNLYDSSYRVDANGNYIDQRGHLIPDSFYGPATKENIVPQLEEVNKSKIAKVEETVRRLKAEGHTVDYEMKVNYAGSDGRPTSFEPKITVDGKECMELDPSLRKIYNGGENTAVQKALTTAGEKFGLANELGQKNGFLAVALTFPVTTVDNVSSYLDGEITAEEMVLDIAGDTATAGIIGYGTTFIATSVSQAMSSSSSALISRIGGSCAPAAAVAFAVESYEDVSDFAQGKIDASELAYNLGENAAGVAGGFAGGAMAGAALGAVAGPGGVLVGGVVGGVVGCALTTEVYATAVEVGSEGVELLADQVENMAGSTIDVIAETVPDQVDNAKAAFNDFFSSNSLPFSV